MSRHEVSARIPGVTVTAGWDNPLRTFFAQVIRDPAPADDSDPVILWIGGSPAEAPRPEDMITPLAPYADLPDSLIVTLRADRAACLDRGPSSLQRALLSRPGRSR